MRKNNNYAYQYYYLAKIYVGVTSLKGYLGLYVSPDRARGDRDKFKKTDTLKAACGAGCGVWEFSELNQNKIYPRKWTAGVLKTLHFGQMDF